VLASGRRNGAACLTFSPRGGPINWPVEVAPNPDPQISLPIHKIMLVVNGIHLLENLKLDEVWAKKVYEFAFVMQPLKAQGFSGSTVAPVAIR